jgi:hypothetical protein
VDCRDDLLGIDAFQERVRRTLGARQFDGDRKAIRAAASAPNAAANTNRFSSSLPSAITSATAPMSNSAATPTSTVRARPPRLTPYQAAQRRNHMPAPKAIREMPYRENDGKHVAASASSSAAADHNLRPLISPPSPASSR